MAPTKQRHENLLLRIPKRRRTQRNKKTIHHTQNTILPKTPKTNQNTNTTKGSGRMNQKGQAEGFAILIGMIIGLTIFCALIWGFPAPELNFPSNNFCQAWANEKNVTHLNGYFRNPFVSDSKVTCKYSNDAETFDGGISEGTIKFKSFKISQQNLEEWRYK